MRGALCLANPVPMPNNAPEDNLYIPPPPFWIMFNMGLTEIIILVLIIIVLFFPQKTKDLVRNMGVAIGAFKEGAKEVEKEIKK